MEKNNKKTSKSPTALIIGIITIILIIAILIISTKNKPNQQTNQPNNSETSNTQTNTYIQEIENGVKLNTSSKMNEAKEAEGYKFTNIQLTTKGGITTLLMTVTNTSGAKTEPKNVNITLLDEQGQELTTLKGVIAELENDASTELNIAATSDYINAYDLTISIE